MYAWCQDMPGVSAEDYAELMANLGGAERRQPGSLCTSPGRSRAVFGSLTFGSQRTPPTGSTAMSFSRQ